MDFIIVGKHVRIDPKSIVSRMSNFILDNPDYFGCFCNILIRAKGSRRVIMKDSIIEAELLKGTIRKEMLDDFNKLLQEFYEKEDADNGKTRGKVVECLITKIGPFSFQTHDVEILRECSIEDEYKNKVGGNKNFDVAFFCKYTCLTELSAEFIESKLDLNNFLLEEPSNPLNIKMSKAGSEKLDYIRGVSETLSDSKHLVLAFATVRYDVKFSQTVLKQMGCDKIVHIFTYNDLKKQVFKC
ncbi:hypothetical protein DCCM_3747 [Desulfocucumis palustris]|uniref:Uncharacterized protein n=1 Tax=Desulfocucumis palustris TaxID=1898651 RepID=A0A2L2XE57_9FIRM|nr:hypothetical protein [Desulfocucumis palustris]GBF34627.1 hypothetical protein DCCM_3747 [Desulfocucumis palustris]